ncbi:MAG: radical SAM protein [Candidatus Rokubacteria bacterium]|nr:radical SAM protein [Candidatus Rokubacteria bacterium]
MSTTLDLLSATPAPGPVPSDPRTGKSLRILFLEPLFPSARIWGKFRRGGGFVQPIGLMTIYSYVRDLGHDAEFCDSRLIGLTATDLTRKLVDGQYDIVGIPVFTNTAADSFSTAQLVRDALPSCTIVLGGVHVTSMPQRSLEECPAADFVVVGEGELTTAELLASLRTGEPSPADIRGLAWRQNGAIVVNPGRDLIKDPNILPHIRYQDVRMDLYVPHPTQYLELPSFNVFTQRGCPYKCTFCQAMVTMGAKVRFKSVDKVIEEIRILEDLWGARGIYFQDSAFTVRKDWVRQLCEKMIEENLGIHWACNLRVDNVTEDLLKLMARAGCWMCVFGIESGNQESLDLMKKGITLKQQQDAVRWCRQAGIQVMNNFILAVPGETEAMVNRTIRYSLELGGEISLYWLPVPYPGTELWRTAKESGGLREDAPWSDFGSMDYKNLVYVNPLLGPDRASAQAKMLDLHSRAYRAFYSSPRTVWRNLRSVRSPRHLHRFYKAALAISGLYLEPSTQTAE